jgi:hypothetical protein
MSASLRISAVVAALVFATACGPHQASVGEGALPARNPNVISQAELNDPAIAAMDALTAIRQLRPSFFRDRGPQTLRSGGDPSMAPGQVRISQDYGPLQAVGALSSIGTRTLVEVRYLNANDATARFGINANGGPVIVVLSTLQ